MTSGGNDSASGLQARYSEGFETATSLFTVCFDVYENSLGRSHIENNTKSRDSVYNVMMRYLLVSYTHMCSCFDAASLPYPLDGNFYVCDHTIFHNVYKLAFTEQHLPIHHDKVYTVTWTVH